MRSFAVLIVLSLLYGSLYRVSAQDVKKEKFSPAIEDNSFLIEEAYNQEERVVQHISNLMHLQEHINTYYYSFTQEWPVGSQLHQLSYTIPLSFIRHGASGPGDIMINYRYQLLGHDRWAAASPRLSLILPTGNSGKGLGTGSYGLQVSLPFSKRLTDKFAAHFNLGATALFPELKDAGRPGIRKLQPSYFWGGSIIWLTASNFNFLVEYLNQANGSFDEKGNVAFENVNIINPGVRFAININRLQIVPGLSVPINIYKNGSFVDSFFYLSFEHPF